MSHVKILALGTPARAQGSPTVSTGDSSAESASGGRTLSTYARRLPKDYIKLDFDIMCTTSKRSLCQMPFGTLLGHESTLTNQLAGRKETAVKYCLQAALLRNFICLEFQTKFG